jgi:hypothetical protein
MIPDLESHAMELAHVLPAHEMFGVRHPVVGDEEGGAMAELL